MAFWSRVKESQIRVLSNRLKRCYFHIHNPTELPQRASSHASIWVPNKPNLTIHTNRVELMNSVRFFAAPIQAKPKKKEKDTGGPRLNEKVTAAFVRLVTDEDHVVISRLEALNRAKSLNLDLVEVDRTAKPPVCKIMDYNKEKYLKHLKEKELAKKKSDLTVRKGGCKLVQFLGKTEKKDLNIKADTIKRMMDKGYRVKCMAMGNGSDNENLGEVLSRLSSLIEDVALIESGPHVEKKHAYIIVRHVKFGQKKKGTGKKASNVAATSSVDSQECEMDSDAADVRVEPGDDCITEDLSDDDVENKLDWRASDANVDTDEVSKSAPFQENRYRGESGNTGPRGKDNRYLRQPANGAGSAERENRYRREPAAASSQTPPAAGENRYRRETVNPSSTSWQASPRGDNNSYRREQPQFNTNSSSSSPQRKSADPRFLNNSSSNGFTEQRTSESSAHRSPASGYGVFNVPLPQAENGPGKQNVATGPNRYKKENTANSARYSTNS
ncbi:PREDICTED: uncharacterized protein LOC109161449 isoform X2 [Ipomoea nil]|uniref:uncharacterized protein LOC109161449 isoform X2 n=1 Tax=Ipomoea nil TaxID=35883 RepID=UPI000901CE59|nr:PREDICTED: uncharacterized protein LOC109161449 isoform X2 [Ipomoea nil]